MEENRIQLHFDKDIRSLGGKKFGLETYKEQIKKHIDYNFMNVLIFPPEIHNISISFVNGLTENIFNEINKDEFTHYFRIIGREKLINKFIKSIFF